MSGRVVDELGTPMRSSIHLTNLGGAPLERYISTDSTGLYSFAGLPAGQYLLKVDAWTSEGSYTALPIAVTLPLSNPNLPVVVKPTYNVSGRVANQDGAGISEATVSVGYLKTITDNNGNWYLSLPAGTHTIKPSKSGYTFSPDSVTLTLSADVENVLFTGSLGVPVTYSLSGRITLNGSGLSGVTINAGSKSATTNANGDYVISGLASSSYTVTPAKSGYDFTPASRIVSAPATNVNFTATPRVTEKPAIILLPGIMGTELTNNPSCSGRSSGKLWLDLTSVRNLVSLYVNDAGNGPDNPCDRIEASNVLRWPISPYGDFISAAANAGFEVLAYPGYDWRLNLADQAAKLDEWIDLHRGNAPKLYLVGHSMGGLLARAYVSNSARASKIDGVVTIGTPYLGAPVLAQRMVEGISGVWTLDLLLWNFQIRKLVHNSPGILQLMPSRTSFSNPSPRYYELPNGQRLESYDATVDYFVNKGYASRTAVDQATQFHDALDGFDRNFYAAGKYTAFYSFDTTTPSTFREQNCDSDSGVCVKVIGWKMGDGTVPAGNASLQFLASSQRNGVSFCSYSAVLQKYNDHMWLLQEKRVIEDILSVLQGKPTQHCDHDVLAVQTAEAAAPTSFRVIEVHGKGNISVTDGQGHFTGVGSNGDTRQDLLDVTFSVTPYGALITLPEGAAYDVIVKQGDGQPMQLTAATFSTEGSDTPYTAQKQTLFNNVASAAGATLSLAAAGAPLAQLKLTLDTNSDGAPDATLQPDAQLTNPVQAQDLVMPVTTLTANGTKDSQGRFTGTVTVGVAASDADSGVLRSYYSTNGGQSWLMYSTPLQLTADAAMGVQAYTVDRAGNQEYPPRELALEFTTTSKLYLPTIQR